MNVGPDFYLTMEKVDDVHSKDGTTDSTADLAGNAQMEEILADFTQLSTSGSTLKLKLHPGSFRLIHVITGDHVVPQFSDMNRW